MKIKPLSIFLRTVFFVLSILFFSCSKKTSEESLAPAVVLTKKAELCLLGRDSKMHPMLNLSAGDSIQAVKINGGYDLKTISVQASGDTEPEENPHSETRKNTKTSYIHAVYNNLDFWIKDGELALDSKNAILIEETALFSDSGLTVPAEGEVSSLKAGTLIALSLETSVSSNKKADSDPKSYSESINAGNTIPSSKIYYYDKPSKKICQAFCNAESVSTSEDDIAVTQIIEALKVTARAVPRNELFIKASKYNPSPKVLAALNAQKTEKQTYSYQKALKSMKNMRYQVHVDELMTVDQSKDPFK